MNRFVAKHVHSSVNAAYWLENPEFKKTSKLQTAAMEAYRGILPFSPHAALKSLFFSSANLLAVSGESVVVSAGADKVNKYMFRYPKHMTLGSFENATRGQIGLVAKHLGGVALTTEVTTKQADIFRIPIGPVPAVTQVQQKIDTTLNPPMRLNGLVREQSDHINPQTLRDIESLLNGCEELYQESNLYPDIYDASHNLRVNLQTGHLTLIDVMPLNPDGTRLIGDLKPNTNKIGDYIDEIRDKVLGRYGG